jgi:hypothetical protein
MFHVNQLVLCVENSVASEYRETCPEKGRVYTVRDVSYEEAVGSLIRLAEIVNLPRTYRQGVQEAWFVSSSFRPIDEARLLQFRKLLAPQPTREYAALIVAELVAMTQRDHRGQVVRGGLEFLREDMR